VLANRGAYVAAALTICRAYIVAGYPGRLDPLASFEGWSDTVRSALVWLGKANAVKSQDVVREEDSEYISLLGVLTAWSDVFGTGPDTQMLLKTVIEAAVAIDEKSYPAQPKWPELYAAIRALIDPRQPLTAEKLSYWLRLRKDRVVGGVKLSQKVDRKNGSRWWVESQDGTQKLGKYYDNAGKMLFEPGDEENILL
jgi:putative DNA primase/helicase